MWNNAEHLIGLPGRAEHGCRAAHAEPAALPRAADLHRQPRRGPGRHRRLDADPAAGQRAAAPDTVATSWSSATATPAPLAGAPAVHRSTAGTTCCRTSPTAYDWPAVDENDAAALCYTSGTTGNPKGVAYSHRSIYLHSMQVCMAESVRARARAQRDLAIVPMFHAMAWGLPYAALHVRRLAAHAGPVPAGRAARRDDRSGAADAGRRGADDLDRPARLPGRQPDRHLLAARRSSSAVRPARRR